MKWLRNVGIKDVAVVLVLFVLAWLGDSVNRSALPDVTDPVPITDLILFGLIAVPLLWRRRFPLSVLVVVSASFIVARWVEVPEGTITSVAMFVALFSAGAYSNHPARDTLRVLAVVVPMGFVIFQLIGHSEGLPGNVRLFQVFSLLLNVVFYGAGWLMGDLWRHRTEDRAELARRAEELERQRHQLAGQAVADERLRIARELHDVVGHHVSVMGVQAGAARRTLGQDPQRTKDLLGSIEESGREAVNEMSRLVGLLRDPEEDPTSPQPTLDHLDDLIANLSEAGLEIEVHRVGRRRQLDSATDLSVFRVIQESLTNALRHGSRNQATVEVSYLVDHLSVRVRNPVEESAGNGAGRGLVGMRERAGLVGGSVEMGRRPDGWFEVEGTFPYRSAQ